LKHYFFKRYSRRKTRIGIAVLTELEDLLQKGRSFERGGAFRKPDYGSAAQNYLEAGRIYLEQKDFENAQGVLLRALDLILKAPDQTRKVKIEQNLALCMFRLGKLTEARNLCQDILNTEGGLNEEDATEVTKLCADVLEASGDFVAASNLMEKVTSYYSKVGNYEASASAYRSLAQKFSKLGNQIESARNLSKAADAYEHIGKFAEAAELFLVAGTQSLTASEPALSKFCLSESVRVYERAIKSVPEGPDKVQALVSYQLDSALPAVLLGNYWEAVRSCEAALSLLRREKLTKGVPEPQFEILRYRLLNSIIDMVRNDPASFGRAKEIHALMSREVKDRHQKMMSTYLDPLTLSKILKRSDILGIYQLLAGNISQSAQFLYVATQLFNREGKNLFRRISFGAVHKVLRCATISLFLANEMTKLSEVCEICKGIVLGYLQDERNTKAKMDMLMDAMYWSFSKLTLTQLVNPETDTSQVQEQFVGQINDYISLSQSKIQHPRFLVYFIVSKLIRNRIEELPQPFEFAKEIENSAFVKNGKLLIDFCLKRDKALTLAAAKGLVQSEQLIRQEDAQGIRYSQVEDYVLASERIGITSPVGAIFREINRLADDGPINVIMKKAKEAEIAGHDHEAATLYEEALQRDYFHIFDQKDLHSFAAAAYKRAGFHELSEAHLEKARQQQEKLLSGKEDIVIGFIFCQKCGTKLPADAMFCFKCGQKTRINPPLSPVASTTGNKTDSSKEPENL
jgi:tetratricopeptide (TPR) repeat protein